MRSVSRGRSRVRFPRAAKKARLATPRRTASRGTSRSLSRRGDVKVDQEDGDTTLSVKTVVKKKIGKFLKGWKKVGGMRFVSTATGTRINAANGQQGSLAIALVGTDAVTSNISLFGFSHLNSLFLNLAADETFVQPTIGTNTRRLMLIGCNLQCRYKNQTTGQVQLTIYDVIARRDRTFNTSCRQDWVDGVFNERDTVLSSSVLGEATPGASPFQSTRFTQQWKVIGVNKVVMHAGSEHTHKVNFKLNRLINQAMFAENLIFGKLTYQQLAVVSGPIAEPTAVDTVGLAAAGVDVVAETRTRFLCMEKSRTVYTNYQNLVGAATQHVAEDTDTVAAVAIA